MIGVYAPADRTDVLAVRHAHEGSSNSNGFRCCYC